MPTLTNFSTPIPRRSQVFTTPGPRLPDWETKLSLPFGGCKATKPVAWNDFSLDMSPMQLGPTSVMP